MFCKKCGYKLSEDAAVCPFCGFKTTDELVKKTSTPKPTIIQRQPEQVSLEEKKEVRNDFKRYDDNLDELNSLGFVNIKTNWFHHILVAGGSYLLLNIIAMIVGVIAISYYRSKGIDFSCVDSSIEACAPEVLQAYNFANDISGLIGELGVIAAVIIIFRKYLKTMFIHFKENNGLKWALIGFAILIGGNIVYSTLLEVLELNSTSSNQEGVNSMIFNSPLLGFLFVVIAAPLSEEILFRFGIFRAFTHHGKKMLIAGLVVTTLLFAGVHMIATIDQVWKDPAAPDYELLKSDLLTLPVYLIGAFGLTFTYYKSKNILSSVLVHMTYNFIGFVGILQSQNMEEVTQCIFNLVRIIFNM